MTNQTELTAAAKLSNLGQELDVPFLKLLGIRCLSAEMGSGEILLAIKPGKVFTREGILNSIWEESVVVTNRTIDVHIRKIREKLGDH